MPLEEGRIYRAPDGRRFTAKIEGQPFEKDRSWALVPTGREDIKNWREQLSKHLFLEHGILFYFDFSDFVRDVRVIDTGWSVQHLIPER